MSGGNASPIGRSHQEMSGANASPIGRSHQEKPESRIQLFWLPASDFFGLSGFAQKVAKIEVSHCSGGL